MIAFPGRPVDGATEDLAQANIVEFVASVREQLLLEASVRGYDVEIGEPVRDYGLDGGGRYGWQLPINGTRISVLIPGVDLTQLCSDSAPPCLHINGRPLPWDDAVYDTACGHRPE